MRNEEKFAFVETRIRVLAGGFIEGLAEAREEAAVAVARFVEEVESGCGGEDGEELEVRRWR